MRLILNAYTCELLRSTRSITTLNSVDLTKTRTTSYATTHDNQVFIALQKRPMQTEEWGAFSTACLRVQTRLLLSSHYWFSSIKKINSLCCFSLLVSSCNHAPENSFFSVLFDQVTVDYLNIEKVQYICQGHSINGGVAQKKRYCYSVYISVCHYLLLP